MNHQNDALNVFNVASTKLLSTKRQVILLISGTLFALANILLTMKRFTGMVESKVLVFGSEVNFVMSLAFIHFVLIPVAALVLSLLLSLIPVRNKKYSHKYISIAVIVMAILHAVFLMLTLMGK